MKTFVIVLAGVIFGVGLTLSGMTDPHRVRGFLDITGAWDPTLMFVMGGAIVAHAPVVWLLRRRGRAMFAPLELTTKTRIDARLIIGAGLFGIGWGLSGFCPGPALVSLVTAGVGAIVFVVGMLGGAWLVGESPSPTALPPAP